MADTIYKQGDSNYSKGSTFRKGTRFKKGVRFNKGTDYTKKGGGTKPAAGNRMFGKYIGKVARGVSGQGAMGLGFPPDDEANTDQQSTYKMGLESYQRALETGDQRRLQGIRNAGIIVHAERPALGWRQGQSLAGKMVDDVDQLARAAYDRFIDSDSSAVHIVYMHDKEIVSQVSFPDGYPVSNPIDAASLESSVVKYLNNATMPEEADGYYVIQNHPDSDIDEDSAKMQVSVAKKLAGYLGGIMLAPGFQYGLVSTFNDQIRMQKRQLPIPTPGEEFAPGFDGPYTVLNTHQDLLGKPTVDENKPLKMSSANISSISQRIERARDTTLLVYSEQGKAVAIQEIPNKLFKKTKNFNEYVSKQMEKYSADEVVAVVDEKKLASAKPTMDSSHKRNLDIKIAKMDEVTLAAEIVDSNTLV